MRTPWDDDESDPWENAENSESEASRKADRDAHAARLNDTVVGIIRQQMTCGECKAATFLVWDAEKLIALADNDDVHRREERRNLTRIKIDADENDYPDGALLKTFLVRCSFFRMNVPDPLRVVNCEAFRQRKSVAD